MNLTSITDKEEVIIKHFVDSIILLKYMDISGLRLLDLGSGAGFPGIPLKIMCEDSEFVLIDSLNKRVNFLNTLIDALDLSGINAVHGRAEDIAFDNEYRESCDVCLSRAVSNLSTLSEFCLPFVKPGGYFVAFKSDSSDMELSDSMNAVNLLGGHFDKVEKYFLPNTDIGRSLIFIDKVSPTDMKYPRRAGIPLKKPLK